MGKIRTRAIPFMRGASGQAYSTLCGSVWKKREFVGPPQTQETESEGHRFRDRGYDIGGPFSTTRRFVVADREAVHLYYNTNEGSNSTIEKYDGPMFPMPTREMSYPSDPATSDSDLIILGTTAISRTSPTNPVANLSVFLGETLRDGLPSIPLIRAFEKRASIAFKAGDEFLNAVFGWAPLVSDVKATAKAIAHAEAVLKQFERDAGKQVRRRYTFDPITSGESDTIIRSGIHPHIGTEVGIDGGCALGTLLPGGSVRLKTRTVKERWFAGAFMYHLPSGYSARSTMDKAAGEAARVFGLDLTPETLWNLTPWSWALDWVTNAGDVAVNISRHSQYGQVLSYGYLMEHSISTKEYSWIQTAPPDVYVGNQVPHVNSVTLVTESKKRIGANPYGFGVTWEGLSPIQTAIATALGLTRSRN